MSEQADLGVFQSERGLLFSIAYRMLGSASDAEDVLQDAWLRYQATPPATIRTPIAFATTIVSRLCLDRLKSARHTREQYVGPWLPEPVLTSDVLVAYPAAGATATPAPDSLVERAESVTLAFLVLLEHLSPEERAVFVLREVFDYDHAEVATMLGISPENSRQLLHRAKAHLREQRPRPPATRPTGEHSRDIAQRFARAFAAGDPAALTALLTADVQMLSDGGGKASAMRRPLDGRDLIVTVLVGLRSAADRSGQSRDASLAFADVNGEPAMLIRVAGRLESVFVFSVDEQGAISTIRVARNPDKLAYIERRLGDAQVSS